MPIHETDHLRLMRVQLDDREAELRSVLGTLQAELTDEANQHFNGEAEDMADEGERRIRTAVRSLEQDRDMAELREIAVAKGRMTHGQYGTCLDCGLDIPSARLEARPTALRCIACQQAFEASHPSVSALRLPPMK